MTGVTPNIVNTATVPSVSQSVGRNAVLSFSTQLIAMTAAFACLPLLVNVLGTARVGVLTLVWSILGYFSVLDLGMGIAVTRGASVALGAGRLEEVRRIFWSGLSVQLTMGFAGSIVLALIAPIVAAGLSRGQSNLTSEIRDAFYLCALAFPLILVNLSVVGVLQSFGRFRLLLFVQAPASIGQYVLPLLVGHFTVHLAWMVAALLLTRAVATCLLFFLARRSLPNIVDPIRPSGREARALLCFGGWATVGAIISPLMVYADRFLIGSVLSLSAVAYYSIPLDAAMRLLVLTSSLAIALYPALGHGVGGANSTRTSSLVIKATKYTLAFVGLPVVLLIVNSPNLLSVWLGNEFAHQSTSVLRILLLGIFANSLARSPFSLIQATGRADVTSLLQLAEVPLYLLLCYALMRQMGITGAAIAWTARALVDSAFLFFLARRFAGFSFGKRYLRELLEFLALLLCLAASTSGAAAILKGEPIRLGITFGMTAVCAIWVWKHFFGRDDRNTILRALGVLGPQFDLRTSTSEE